MKTNGNENLHQYEALTDNAKNVGGKWISQRQRWTLLNLEFYLETTTLPCERVIAY